MQGRNSIVAVHGLSSDASNSWLDTPEVESFLAKRFLPSQIPDARIITFTYNATLVLRQSTAKVISDAKSLLSSLVDTNER